MNDSAIHDETQSPADDVLKSGREDGVQETESPAAESVEQCPDDGFTMQKVESSNVDAIGWNSGTLAVKFKSDEKIFTYAGVSREVFDEFLNTESKGKYFAENIKGKFPESHTLTPAENADAPAEQPKEDHGDKIKAEVDKAIADENYLQTSQQHAPEYLLQDKTKFSRHGLTVEAYKKYAQEANQSGDFVSAEDWNKLDPEFVALQIQGQLQALYVAEDQSPLQAKPEESAAA